MARPVLAHEATLMKKHILIAAIAAFLALPTLSASVSAEAREAFDDAGEHRSKFSPETLPLSPMPTSQR
jgi:hypothetical protein